MNAQSETAAPVQPAGIPSKSERARRDKLERRLMRCLKLANQDHNLFASGDRIMVGISGGKDSYTLLKLLQRVRMVTDMDFELVGVNLDQGHPGFPGHVIEDWFKAEGFEYRMLKKDTYSIVLDKVKPGKTTCSLCSRLRRGILYNAAQELGCNKIALGHHRDDLLETLLLNLFFSGQLKSMAPKLHADDGKNVVIRPLAYAPEEEIAEYSQLMAFPIVPCNLCGSQDNMQRQLVKGMLTDMSSKHPQLKGHMLAAMKNVRVTHLMDPALLALKGYGTGVDEDVL